MKFTETIAKLVSFKNLTETEAYTAMNTIMSGRTTDAQIASFITALRMKGENCDEIFGFVKAIRNKCKKTVINRTGIVDTCGTGGDKINTFNISTTAAFVAAACGLPVAKHGNHSVSSSCGSADVLEALGVNIYLSPEAVAGCIDNIGIGFLYAPVFHEAMKHAVRARKDIAMRTVFNMLGPLVNPFEASVQLVGVYDPALMETIAEVMVRLGISSALVVYGEGGMDEVSTIGPTRVVEIRNGKVSKYEIDPGIFGLPSTGSASLAGGDPRANAMIMMNVLKGNPGPRQDIVVANAAAVLYAAGEVKGLTEGAKQAREVIDSGDALEKLKMMKEYTNEVGRKEAGAGEYL